MIGGLIFGTMTRNKKFENSFILNGFLIITNLIKTKHIYSSNILLLFLEVCYNECNPLE